MTDTTPGGYMNKMLRVDLTNNKLDHETVPADVIRKYIGGTGIGVKYLYDEVPPGVDWDSPENRIILATGPLTGTTAGGSGTFSVITKGPLNNGAGTVQANGYLGAFLKFSGFDGIIVQGSASKPVYLYLHDGIAELRDASHLWGKDTWQTDELIKEELGKKERELSVFGIGPAGENLVKFAAFAGDKGHVAAHNGIGAVFGSKKLKAIAAARGKATIPVKDKEKLSSLSKELVAKVTTTSKGPYEKWGTLGDIEMAKYRMTMAMQPVKNYQTIFFNDVVPFSAEESRNKYEIKWVPCWGCKFHHCHLWKITEGPHAGFVGDEPEYEGMAALTSVIGQTDNEEAFVLCNEVDRLGMDVNEMGWLIGWVMECYEKGILTKKDTDGLEVTWGNVEAVRKLLYKIAKRDGFGNILAEGVKRASRHYGDEASKIGIYTKKGNTPRGHDDRSYWTMLLDVCTSDMGLDTDSSLFINPAQVGLPADTDPFTPDGAPLLLTRVRGRGTVIDSLVMCKFHVEGGEELIPQMLSAVTGWDVTPEELHAFGLRVVNLLRAFNLRHGMTSDQDAPSERFGSAPSDGPFKGISVLPVWDKMLRNYYELMGWDKDTGKPLPETLKSLGLDSITKDL
ncbi:aldehyde ferredoxin oxidoreductase family protein [Chloroflexota bacterium]